MIRATFTGTDSPGYINGEEYTLKFNVRFNGTVSVSREDYSGFTEYASLMEFHKHWDVVNVVGNDPMLKALLEV